MNLIAIGCSFRNTPVEVRERLALDDAKVARALGELSGRFACEAVILNTCNRVELYLARASEPPPGEETVAEFLGELHSAPAELVRRHLYSHAGADAVRHLFRVTASLDSMVVGEGQIAKQVREAFERSQKGSATGSLLNVLFPQAVRAAKRARTETGIALGHVSVSSVAVDYVRQVFDHFEDKTVLIIGAGKMGRLTLKHLRELNPKRVLVTNRSPEKAEALARECGGVAVPFGQLDDAMVQSDIVLSTTGASEPIMTRSRFEGIRRKRKGGPVVILDIAVPRDFDPKVGDCADTFLFNIDDLTKIREQTIAQRQKHIAPAEAILERECKKFCDDWAHRKHVPVIRKLTESFDQLRQAQVKKLFGQLNGKLGDEERKLIEWSFRQLQNQFLGAPIEALRDASKDGTSANLLEAIRKLFRLSDS